eukprot:5744501-Prymnesium_polylepis.1
MSGSADVRRVRMLSLAPSLLRSKAAQVSSTSLGGCDRRWKRRGKRWRRFRRQRRRCELQA